MDVHVPSDGPIICEGEDTGVHDSHVFCLNCRVMWAAPMPDDVVCGKCFDIPQDALDGDEEFTAQGMPKVSGTDPIGTIASASATD